MQTPREQTSSYSLLHSYLGRIDYLHAILQTKTGVLTSKNKIKRLSIKLGEYSGHYLNIAETLKKLKGAWKEYRATKKLAHALRITFQEEIIARKSIDRKVTTEQLTKMMIREERARQENRDSRQTCGRKTKSIVLKAKVTDFITGITGVIETQEKIVAAAAKFNLRGQIQTAGTAFCLSPL